MTSELSFTNFILTRRVTDTPRGDFVADTKFLIGMGRFPVVVGSWDSLESFLYGRHACPGAMAAGRQVWREYRRAAR
jgi:hypothetical protein